MLSMQGVLVSMPKSSLSEKGMNVLTLSRKAQTCSALCATRRVISLLSFSPRVFRPGSVMTRLAAVTTSVPSSGAFRPASPSQETQQVAQDQCSCRDPNQTLVGTTEQQPASVQSCHTLCQARVHLQE